MDSSLKDKVSTTSDADFGFNPPLDRKLFEDITPLPQSPSYDPYGQPCSIKYTSRFDEVMSLFRALRVRKERSRRMLGIAGEAVILNAANYTAWKERRNCLSFLLDEAKSVLEKNDLLLREVSFTNRVVADLSCYKNYQVWQHRKVISQLLGEAHQELDSSLQALSRDAKNYHAWSHRQWALSFLFSKEKKEKEEKDTKHLLFLLDAELTFTEELLGMKRIEESSCAPRVEIMEVDGVGKPLSRHDDDNEDEDEEEDDEVSGAVDVFNNSAWNHRYFCLFILGKGEGLLDRLPSTIVADEEEQRKHMWKRDGEGITETSAVSSAASASSSSSTTTTASSSSSSSSSFPVSLRLLQEVQFANRALLMSPSKNESALSYLRALETIERNYAC
jgi:hypothetical protein